VKAGPPGAFATQLKTLREAAGFTQEELATIAGLSVHAVSALERGERRRPHVDTVRALSAALDLNATTRDALLASARPAAQATVADDLNVLSLPVPVTPLLGREADLDTLNRWLVDPTARLITLVGPGGVGKTRLALELARNSSAQGANRVLFVPLAAIGDAGMAACAIAEALGLADLTGQDLARRARAACDGAATLMVLDNFEQLLEAAPLIAELLTSVTALRLLVTSRAPLRVRGEREYAVVPLALAAHPETLAPADLARAPAVRLFIERVREVQPDFRLTAENGTTVAAICRRLDALPLALELAARWIKALSVEQLLGLLERDVLLSAAGPRDLPERQQTMNATVAWSYQLLDPEERRAFRRFGALPGLFSLDAAGAVLAVSDSGSRLADETAQVTAGLIDKSLLVRAEQPFVEGRPLYYMFETVRAYAVRELVDAGERNAAMEGLARYCADEASLAQDGLVGLEQAAWLDRVRENLESYRSALAWLLERGRAVDAGDIAWKLMFFWLIRGYAAEGLWWYEEVLKAPALPPAAEAHARRAAATMLYAKGDHQRARVESMRSLILAREVGDLDTVAQTEHLFGHIEYAVGDMDAARARFASSVESFRALPNAWGVGQALSGMAEVALATGHEAEAERLLDESATALDHAGPWFQLLGSYVRVALALRRGTPDEAIRLVRDSLLRIRALRDKFAFVYTLVPLAAAAALKGDAAWAARVLAARDALVQRTGVLLVDARMMREYAERTEREARKRLGADRWARAYAAGRRTSIDTLLQDIDRVLTQTPV
jgi:predicted ATPase/transcriptional regulator with XRE-family HTH domain